MRVTLVLWLTMHIGVIAGLPSRMESLELRMTKLEESLRKFITAFASHPESGGKGDRHVMKRQAVDEGDRNLDDVLSEISVNGIVTLLRGRDGHDGEDGSPGVPGVPGRDGRPGSPGDQGPRGLEGNCSHTCQARPAPRDNIWRQGDVENFLKVTNLPALSQMTTCFYYKPSHIGHVGEVTHILRALISIASDSDYNEFLFGFRENPALYLGLYGQPETNSISYGLEAFSEAHRHCFVWSDGNFLKWFYDSDTPGVLKLAAQVADSGSSNIPASSTLVLLNEQDSKGGSLDVRQMIAGDIADFQMWDRALSDSQVVALGCGEVGNVVTFDDITPVGISHFHRDSTFQCSNSN